MLPLFFSMNVMSAITRSYIAIDLKSFYASVECVERGLNAMTTNLVVADESRTDKTICLAVTPSLKSFGIPGRARLFEVRQKMREVNHARRIACGGRFSGKSYLEEELTAHPDYEVDFLIAPPRMAYYIEYSTRIYKIYLKYVSEEDIHVYSIDEVFMDVTNYLKTYKMSAHQLAMKMIQDVLRETGITATAGIGTNMYLCKVAMDIVAKKMPADSDGVRIAELDEKSYRRLLWNHQPLTDFWRVGRGIAKKLRLYGIDTMGELARCSVENEELLYKLFGVNAELLIDHAWGWEPCTIKDVKSYRPENHSLSSGQVLHCAYDNVKARVVVQEMADAMASSLLEKRLMTDQLVLSIGYDMESLKNNEIQSHYQGEVVADYYGRVVPKPANGSVSLPSHTSSLKVITAAVLTLFDKNVNPKLLVRRINLTANHVLPEAYLLKKKRDPIQLDLFTDYETLRKKEEEETAELEKERRVQLALLSIKQKYGKNSVLRGLNLKEGATAKDRNEQIGGHKA